MYRSLQQILIFTGFTKDNSNKKFWGMLLRQGTFLYCMQSLLYSLMRQPWFQTYTNLYLMIAILTQVDQGWDVAFW